MANIEVKLTDNSRKVLEDLARKKLKALEIIGLTAEGYAKRLCAVDTGRLRNSITHATSTFSGVGTYSDNEGNKHSDASAKSTPEEDSVYIGTNVEYAPYVELGTVKTSAQPFLRPAAANHMEQYKSIIRRVMEDEL